jgi:hypothetical protein
MNAEQLDSSTMGLTQCATLFYLPRGAFSGEFHSSDQDAEVNSGK